MDDELIRGRTGLSINLFEGDFYVRFAVASGKNYWVPVDTAEDQLPELIQLIAAHRIAHPRSAPDKPLE